MSRVGVGIDFGTSNSVAAVYDGENLSLIPLEKGQDIMPSATYLDSSKVAITGEVAVSTYIRDNTGRTVELVPEVIGVKSEFSGSEDGEEITSFDPKEGGSRNSNFFISEKILLKEINNCLKN